MTESGGTKVGSIFYESSLDSKGFEKGAGTITKGIDSLKNQLGSLNPAIKAVGAAFAAYLGAQTIVGFFKSVVEATNEANRIMAQTQAVIQSTGGVAGYTADQIAKLAQEIQNTTPISDEAAQSGINMLLTFTKIGHETLPAATQAMVDMATAMNGGVTPGAEELRGTAIQLGKALQDPILGMTALRRVGVNFNKAQQEMVQNLVESNRLLDAQTFILNELSREFGGSASAQAQTFEGQVQSLNNRLDDLKEGLGRELLPALSFLVESLSGAAGSFSGILLPMRAVASAVIILTALFNELAIIISTVFGVLFGAITKGVSGAVSAAKTGLSNWIGNAMSAQDKLTNLWVKGSQKQTKAFLGGLDDQTAGSSKAAKKIAKDLEDETEKYNTELKKRNKQFDQSLADMIWAHQDKVKQLKKDLSEENADFDKRMSEQTRTFKEAMAEMEKDHNKTIKSLEKDLAEETQTHEQKVATIQAQIDQEESYGKNARQSRLTALKTELAEEITSYNQKAADIQAKIEEENVTYQEAVAKKQEANLQEIADLQTTHAQKTADIQSQLTTEEGILSAHQGLVDSIKDKAREDDIARLVRQHEEENVEAEVQHQKRMVDIVAQGQSEGAAGGGAFSDAMNTALDNLKKDVDTKTKDMATAMVENIAKGAKEAGIKILTDFWNAAVDKAKSIKKATGGILSGLIGIGPAIDLWASAPKFAAGTPNFAGGPAIVGEAGPELVNLPRGSSVTPARETSNILSKPIVNIYIDKMSKDIDIDRLGREIGFRLSLVPR